MPIPKPTNEESKEDFISRCMSDSIMLDEFEDEAQRSAVCHVQWDEKDKKTEKKLQTNIKTLSNFSRTEKYEGREYLVLPAVLLTEGVHNGLYYPPEEISKFPGAWNNRPIPIQHPQENGSAISCNSPQVLCDCVGMVFNTKYQDGKLKGELWVDKIKLQEKDRTTFLQLLSGNPIDISTGLWSDEINIMGDWNGESYTAIVQNIRPDHVALLPGQVGACSWKDGCGAPRINMEEVVEEKEKEVTETEPMAESFWARFKSLFVTNKKSHEDIAFDLKALVSVPEGHHAYVASVYDDHFIYTTESGNGNDSPKTFQQNYVVNEGVVSLVGDPMDLVAQFVPVSNTNEKTDCTCDRHQSSEGDEELNINKENEMSELVDKLISDERNQFSDEDREWLKTLDQDKLEKFTLLEEKVKDPEEEEEEEKEEEVEPKMNAEKEQIGLALSDVLASKEFAQAVAMAVKTLSQRERKSQLVDQIRTLKLNFTEDELYEMPDSVLDKLVKINAAGDFSGRGGCGDQYNAEDNEPPEPPKILTSKEGRI